MIPITTDNPPNQPINIFNQSQFDYDYSTTNHKYIHNHPE